MRKIYLLTLVFASIFTTAGAATLSTGKQLVTEKLNAPRKSSPLITNKAAIKGVKVMDSERRTTAVRKAGSNASIEGTWTFNLGDYYFQTSVGPIQVDFEASLMGDQVMFADPTGNELPFIADFNTTTNVLTFNVMYLGTALGYFIYQEPYVYDYGLQDLVPQPITATYSPEKGVISFAADNGISWVAYEDQQGTTFAGYFGIYDLEEATKSETEVIPIDPIDEEQEGQWKTVGMATFVDAWILPSYSMGGVQIDPNQYPYEVELQQNVSNENLYRLWEPYKNSILQDLNSSKYHGQIQFDVTDPDHVEVVACGLPSGFKNNQGEFYLSNELGWLVNFYGMDKETIIPVIYEGAAADTFKDGVVTITSPLFDFEPTYSAGYSWQNNPYHAIITFPKEEVAEDPYFELSEPQVAVNYDDNEIVVTFSVASFNIEDDPEFSYEAVFTPIEKEDVEGETEDENENLSIPVALSDDDNSIAVKAKVEDGIGRAVLTNLTAGEYSYNIVLNAYDGEGNLLATTSAESVPEVTFTLTSDITLGINGITTDSTAPVYFNLQGVKVANPSNGIYIVRKGNDVRKVIVK